MALPADYDNWRSNFGTSSSTAAGSTSTTATAVLNARAHGRRHPGPGHGAAVRRGFDLIKDVNPRVDMAGSDPAHLVNVDGVLYFAASTATHGVELWKSDGTAEGTVLIKRYRDREFRFVASQPH